MNNSLFLALDIGLGNFGKIVVREKLYEKSPKWVIQLWRGSRGIDLDQVKEWVPDFISLKSHPSQPYYLIAVASHPTLDNILVAVWRLVCSFGLECRDIDFEFVSLRRTPRRSRAKNRRQD